MQFKRVKRPIHGVLLLDKPIGYSSNQALQKVKWLYQAAKAGHTGTLDPLATGVLPICLGEATKFSHYLLEADKTYVATLRLGVTTTTGDAEGEILERRVVHHSPQALAQVFRSFVGDIAQTPPMYSALKHEGKPLYEYARAGIVIERPARNVTIHHIQLLSVAKSKDIARSQEGDINDILTLEVACSKGTYIRTLAEDIGQALGCGAHLVGLRRTQTAHYTLQNSYTIEALEAMTLEQRDACLLAPDSTLTPLASVDLTAESAYYFEQGQPVWVSKLEANQDYKVYQGLKFLGLGEVQADGQLKPKRLVVNL